MISISDRIAIVNALMQEDREELRLNKTIMLNSTYFAISGIIAVSAFAIARKDVGLSRALLAAIWCLFGLHFVSFRLFLSHMDDIRACLSVREAYYQELGLLEREEPFAPLKSFDTHKRTFKRHAYLWFLPGIVLAVAIVNSAFVML